MTKFDYPRLCGGTMFTLVLEARKPRMTARDHYNSNSDGLSDPEVLTGLIQVANPDYTNPGKKEFKTPANNYKSCGVSTGLHLPFDDQQMVRAFDTCVKARYTTAINRMTAFVETFLDDSKEIDKRVNLARALIDLIQQDVSIDDKEEFFVDENGRKEKKAALGDLTKICLPALLLGVWHYVIMNRADNSVGQTTYNRWCPSAGGGPRKYQGDMGVGIMEGLEVYMPKTSEETKPDDTIIEEESDFREQSEQASEPSQQTGIPVVNNNPIIIQQNGNGNMVIPNYGTININKR